MGFMDKVTAGVKNVDNKIGAGIDESKYNIKIHDLKKDAEEMKSKLGENIYKAFSKDETYDHKPCCAKIKAIYEKIDATEKEKQEMLDATAAERENIRKEAKTKN